MDDALRQKIVKELESSGIGTEMIAAQKFLARDWQVSAGANYFDRDEEQTREYDINAYRPYTKFKKTKEKETLILRCFYHLACEVKKTGYPWVVLRSQKVKLILDGWNNLIYTDNFPVEKSRFAKCISHNTIVHQLKWIGRGIHEFGKKKNKKSVWYQAFIQACKAANYILENESLLSSRPAGKTKFTCFTFVRPVVLVDSPMYYAILNDGGGIDVGEVDMFTMPFEFATRKYEKRTYQVDTVRLDAINEYLELSEARHDRICDEFEKACVSKIRTGTPPYTNPKHEWPTT